MTFFHHFYQVPNKGAFLCHKTTRYEQQSQCEILGQSPSGVVCQFVGTDKVVFVSTRTHSLTIETSNLSPLER